MYILSNASLSLKQSSGNRPFRALSPSLSLSTEKMGTNSKDKMNMDKVRLYKRGCGGGANIARWEVALGT